MREDSEGSIDAADCVFFGEAFDLQCDFYFCSWYLSDEDDVSEGVVEESFDVALFDS